MADKYLVPCTCGQTLRVGVHQAGSPLQCQCGAEVVVPPLRKLRELPREAGEAAPSPGAWSPRHAVVFGGALLTVLLLAWAGWNFANEPRMPEFDTIRERQLSERTETILENAPPVEFWKSWLMMESDLATHGFDEIPDPQQQAWKQYAMSQRWQRSIILTAAGVVALITLVGGLVWPSARSNT